MRRQFLVNVTRAGRYRGPLKDVGSKADIKGASILQDVKVNVLCRRRSCDAAPSHCFTSSLGVVDVPGEC